MAMFIIVLQLLMIWDKFQLKVPIYLCKSTNNGQGWATPVLVHEADFEIGEHDDKPWMVVDRTRSPNRVYVAWTRRRLVGTHTVRDMLFSYAPTNNFTFQAFSANLELLRSGSVDAAGLDLLNEGAAIAVAPNGNLYVAWIENKWKSTYRINASTIFVAKSTNGGDSFITPLITVKSAVNPANRKNQQGSFRYNSFPTIVVSPTTSYVHLAWCELDEATADKFLKSSVIQSGRIAFGGVAPTPWQDAAINHKLSGLAISGDSFAQLSESSFANAEVLAMNAYKVPLVRNLMKRLLTQLTA